MTYFYYLIETWDRQLDGNFKRTFWGTAFLGVLAVCCTKLTELNPLGSVFLPYRVILFCVFQIFNCLLLFQFEAVAVLTVLKKFKLKEDQTGLKRILRILIIIMTGLLVVIVFVYISRFFWIMWHMLRAYEIKPLNVIIQKSFVDAANFFNLNFMIRNIDSIYVTDNVFFNVLYGLFSKLNLLTFFFSMYSMAVYSPTDDYEELRFKTLNENLFLVLKVYVNDRLVRNAKVQDVYHAVDSQTKENFGLVVEKGRYKMTDLLVCALLFCGIMASLFLSWQGCLLFQIDNMQYPIAILMGILNSAAFSGLCMMIYRLRKNKTGVFNTYALESYSEDFHSVYFRTTKIRIADEFTKTTKEISANHVIYTAKENLFEITTDKADAPEWFGIVVLSVINCVFVMLFPDIFSKVVLSITELCSLVKILRKNFDFNSYEYVYDYFKLLYYVLFITFIIAI